MLFNSTFFRLIAMINTLVGGFFVFFSGTTFIFHPTKGYPEVWIPSAIVSVLIVFIFGAMLTSSFAKENAAQAYVGQGLAGPAARAEDFHAVRRQAIREEEAPWILSFVLFSCNIFYLVLTLSVYVLVLPFLLIPFIATIWVLIWIIIFFISRRYEKTQKTSEKKIQIQKYPKILREVFQYYDTISYLDLARLLFLAHPDQVKLWLDTLGEVSGLHRRERDIYIDYPTIVHHIDKIVDSYISYDFKKILADLAKKKGTRTPETYEKEKKNHKLTILGRHFYVLLR
jgi:hypothetical protein